MATNLEFVLDVCERLRNTGDLRYRKMFGEYLVYVDDKPMVLLCDNTAFVKILPALDDLMKDARIGLPYEGGKPHYILDVEDAALCEQVIKRLKPVTQVPKKRAEKRKNPPRS